MTNNSSKVWSAKFWLGVDGGGTHTRAALADAQGRVLAEGHAEAANLVRVGLHAAVANLQHAIGEACEQLDIAPAQISAGCFGLAGVGNSKHHAAMLAALQQAYPSMQIQLETDARIALAGATDLQPGVVIIAGTGSIACGINAAGEFARAGGWGPAMGDEGSGSYIGRRALESVVMAYDGRGPETSLSEPLCAHFGVSTPPELPAVIYDQPVKVMREIAQLSRLVNEQAQAGDITAKNILSDAAKELARTALAVVRQLQLTDQPCRIAYVGGVFTAGTLVLNPLRRMLQKHAPQAVFAPPLFPPTIGAVKLALAAAQAELGAAATTEQTNPHSAHIDKLATVDALRVINAEDRKVPEAIERVLPVIARAVDGIAARLKNGGRLFYSGTGTSGRLGILDASECPPTFGVSPELVQGVIAGGYEACYKAVEASEDDREAGARDLQARGFTAQDVIIGIAASGRTPYTIGAVEYGRSIGALTICITCNSGSALAQAVEIPIEAIVGPEVIAGSTRLKSGTAQKLILNMLSTMTMVRLGYVTGNRMTNLKTSNIKLRQRATGIVMAECGLEEDAAKTILEAANWDLRIAIVMQKANVNRECAHAALAANAFTIAGAVDWLKTQAPV